MYIHSQLPKLDMPACTFDCRAAAIVVAMPLSTDTQQQQIRASHYNPQIVQSKKAPATVPPGMFVAY